MALPTIIRVDELEAGTVVKVLLSSIADSKFFSYHPDINGLFRVFEGEDPKPINQRDWRRVVGFSRRKFIASVVANDTEKQELVLAVEDSHTTKNRKVRYQVFLPYNQIIRLSRLVPQGREFDSVEDEQAFRRQHRSTPVNKAFFDPKDRFVGVQLLAIIGAEQVVTSITHQVAATGASFTVDLPSGVLDDADYTVVSGYNTVVGAAAPTLSIPEASKTVDNFLVETVDGSDVEAGTTLDFQITPR